MNAFCFFFLSANETTDPFIENDAELQERRVTPTA